MPVRTLLLRDWEDFGEKDIPAYFEKVYTTLLRRLDLTRRLDRPLGVEEEKELRFMLEALIEAKQTSLVIPAEAGIQRDPSPAGSG